MTDERPSGTLVPRLLESAAESSSTAASEDAAHLALDRLSTELCRWLGPAACSALLQRALKRTRRHHPALDDVRVDDGLPPRLTGMADTRDRHDEDDLAAGLEATLAEVIELLCRLIGDELCARLAELSMAGSPGEDTDAHAAQGEPE